MLPTTDRRGSALAEIRGLIGLLEDAEDELLHDTDAPARIVGRLITAVYKSHRALCRAAQRGYWR